MLRSATPTRLPFLIPKRKEADKFENLGEDRLFNLVLKADGEGRVIRLRDVAKIEIASDSVGRAYWHGTPAVVMAVHALRGTRPSDLQKAVSEKLNVLRERLPLGIDLDFVADFSSMQTNQAACYRIDLDLSDGASVERTAELAKDLVQGIDGVKNTLILLGRPLFHADNQGCLLVQIDADREAKAWKAIRTTLQAEVREASIRVCDMSRSKGFTLDGYPLNLAVSGPTGKSLRMFAEQLADRLRQRKD